MVPPLIVNEEVSPVAGISKLAIVPLALGGFEEPIDVVRVPPLMLNVITLVDVAVAGANLAATLTAPPSMVKTELLPHVNELFVVPTLYVPADTLNEPLSVTAPFCAITVAFALFNHKPAPAAIVYDAGVKKVLDKVKLPDTLNIPAVSVRKFVGTAKLVEDTSTILLFAAPVLLTVIRLKFIVVPAPLTV